MTPRRGATPAALLELVDPEHQRLEREVGLRLGRLQQRHLELDARLAAVLDRGDRRREEVDRAQDLALREALGLSRQAVGVLGRDGERVGHVAERLHHEQVAQVRGEVAHELREVAPGLGQRLHRQERRARVAVGERLARGEHQLGVRHAEDLEHVVELHLVAAVGDELLERAERVAEGAGGRAREHPDGGVGDLDPLLARDPAQHAGDLLERRALEVEAVAAVDDRGRDLVRLGRGEHEHHVRGGSSSVFRNAFHAAVVSMCASSRM